METLSLSRSFFFVSLLLACLCCCPVSARQQNGGLVTRNLKFILGEENLGPWRTGMSEAAAATGAAEAPGPSADNNTLVLAEKRTDRPDVLRRFRHYKGGWNITNRHYWASVGFTGAPGFIIGITWFFIFGLALALRYICKWTINIKGENSDRSQGICLILLIVFTCAAAAISDTCVAMEQWVDHPHSVTALSSILPCVDQSTTNKTLIQSKQVINGIVTIVNTYIYTFADANPSPNDFNYYNQSGPLLPPLCYPFDNHLQDRECSPQEVSLANASEVWKKYMCEVSASGVCTTVGRVTPEVYSQLVAAVTECYALEHYAPVLLSLEDCKFVRDTFEEITSKYFPKLEHYLKIINAGLGLISVGILLCLVLWILYANRPQREEAFVVKSPLQLTATNGNPNRREDNANNSPMEDDRGGIISAPNSY